MSFKFPSLTATIMMASTPATTPPVAEEEEYYSSWSLFLVCILLVLSLLTSYYLQIKRIRAVHETLVSIFAGMFVGLVIRLAPGTMIRDMLVSPFDDKMFLYSHYLRCLSMWTFIRRGFVEHSSHFHSVFANISQLLNKKCRLSGTRYSSTYCCLPLS